MSRGKKARIWERPLRIAILEILERKGGRITEKELTDKLKEMYTSISEHEINAELMHLELNRLIYVDSSTPTNKVIELLTEKKWFKAIGGTE
ncbi:MAG: hypothetical protein NDP13_03620 [Crenarchaeota archaeon]|nr:hypothetical protein [Thermoproteota archaeon]MCR8454059.1 hypothetical protein [Thermoproteota archaeon]MCR8456041.1 hypothetical protein [Thermoproteota archaeon]MCR8462954.1 hypothetical protein [Thermoproteota archaeon]MCR8471131.1 hypothetical protein [Thermoproteota archaeon]